MTIALRLLFNNKLRLAALAVLMSSLPLSGCFTRNVAHADKVEFIYTDPNWEDRSKDRKMSAFVDDEDDKREILRILSSQKIAPAGDCGYDNYAVFVYKGDRVYRYFIGGDDCGMILGGNARGEILTDAGLEIPSGDILAFKALVYKYLPDKSFLPFTKEWSVAFAWGGRR